MNSVTMGMIFGALFGLLVGLIPMVLGATKNKLNLGIAGFFACAVSGAILGLLLAGPVCGYFAWRVVSETKAEEERTAALKSSSDVELTYWQSIQNSSNPADFEAYINRYPQGQFSELARNRLRGQTGIER